MLLTYIIQQLDSLKKEVICLKHSFFGLRNEIKEIKNKLQIVELRLPVDGNTKLRELRHSGEKLIEKYIDLERRIKVLEREKAAEKTVASKKC